MNKSKLSNMSYHIKSVKENPEITPAAISYFQQAWSGVNPIIYQDCIENSIKSPNPLPQWYLLFEGDKTMGCVGLITNDFISRMDLYPWLCALYIAPEYRGKGLSKLLIDQVIADTKRLGFSELNLCTDHIGYYERFGFTYIGIGYHP